MAKTKKTTGGMKVYVYQHKKDKSRWGILEASGRDDAVRWLGSCFKVRTIVVDHMTFINQMMDAELRERIVWESFNPL